MSLTHKVGVTYSNDAGTITSTTDTYVVDSEVNLDDIVAAGSTNKEYDIQFAIANIKCMCLMATQNMTLKTNSTTAPQETITLVANKQLVWTVDHIESKYFAGNVTKFFFTNGGAVDGQVKFRCGIQL